MRMQAVLTQLGVSLALVTLAIMEMESPVQVCDYVTIIYKLSCNESAAWQLSGSYLVP